MGASLTKQQGQSLYEVMVRIREFEEQSIVIYGQGLTPGRVHPYIGEEAVAAGACAALGAADKIVSTHRGGGHLVARGADLHKVFAEFMGRATGYCSGKGGPMHFGIPELGLLCTNGIVGSGITVAAGAALAAQLERTDQVVMCFFGDGAANTGSFHEGLNLAAVWKVPAVFVCENNAYAETMPFERAFAIKDIAVRATGYGMPGVIVDGNDVEAVWKAATEAVTRARDGGGPSLIEAKTYRISGHFHGESPHYRSQEEIDAWKQKDPIERYGKQLIRDAACSQDELNKMREAAKEEMTRAIQLAQADPFPSLDTLATQVRLPLAWEVAP